MNLQQMNGNTTFYLKGITPDLQGSHTLNVDSKELIFHHEVGHKLFSNNPDLGHSVLNKLKEYKKSNEFGHPTGYSAVGDLFDATMMDFYAFYRLKPKELKISQPKAYNIMRSWVIDYLKDSAK